MVRTHSSQSLRRPRRPGRHNCPADLQRQYPVLYPVLVPLSRDLRCIRRQCSGIFPLVHPGQLTQSSRSWLFHRPDRYMFSGGLQKRCLEECPVLAPLSPGHRYNHRLHICRVCSFSYNISLLSLQSNKRIIDISSDKDF